MKLIIYAIILLFFLNVGSAQAKQESVQQLKEKISKITDLQTRCDSAMQWIKFYGNDKQEAYLLDVVYDAALKLADEEHQAYALRQKARFVYNTQKNKVDSLMYYDKKISEIPGDSKMIRKYKTDTKSFVCYTLIYNSNYMQGLDLVNEFVRDSESRNDGYALATSYELLGIIYQNLFQFDEALNMIQKAYDYLPDDKEYHNYANQLAFEVNDHYIFAGREREMLSAIEDAEKEFSTLDPKTFPQTDRCRYMLDVYRLAYSIATNDMDKAKEMYDRIQSADMQNVDIIAVQLGEVFKARYFLKLGDARSAYNAIDMRSPNAPIIHLKERVEVLKAVGKYKDALEMEDSISNYYETIVFGEYMSQLNEMRTKFEVFNLEQDKSDKITQIYVIIFIFSIILVAVFVYLYIRTRKDKKTIEKANSTQKVFLQNMSHEIRTPLNAICGFAQILTNPDLRGLITADELTQYGEIIRSNTDMLSTLVNDILDVSDMENGTYRLHFSDCSVNQICQKAINTVSYRCPDHIKLYMTSDVEDDYMIYSDFQRSEQIIINYLTNAIKHTFQGEIHVHCSLTENPGQVTFSVTDTGEGVPADKSERVFGRFEKLDSFKQGTGLGLAICRKLAELMNGKVYLDTSYKLGARFVFVHPQKI